MMIVEFGLSNLYCRFKIIVRKSRIDDLVTVLRETSRLDASWDRSPAVEEEDFHGVILAESQGG